MHGAAAFLQNLTVVLGVAAVTTVLFQRLHLPVVLGYILAGLLIGPHVPIAIVADKDTVETLSSLGVILLMFSLGLEFNLGRLRRVAPTAGVVALIEVSVMMALGFGVARAFGWGTRQAIFTGAMLAISSTTIIAKAFEERRVDGRLRELVFAVLIVEDLLAILLLAILTPVGSGAGLSAGELGATLGRLGGFLVALVVIGLFVVPRAIRAIVRLQRPETTLVASIGFCFAVALVTRRFGYSEPLGAFLAGSLVAESGKSKTIEHLVQPVRDLFVAIFFVAVGMTIEPKLIVANWLPIVVFSLVVVIGKVGGVTLGGLAVGSRLHDSVRAGMSMSQIGEFSFIIAGLGLATKATAPELYPIAVAVSAATTLTTPLAIRAAGPFAAFVDRKLPQSLHTFLALYASWIEGLRTPAGAPRARQRLPRAIQILVADAVVLAFVIIAGNVMRARLVATLVNGLGLSETLAYAATIAAQLALAAPFALASIGAARRIGAELALRALPSQSKEGALDLAATPRRAFVVTLQLLAVLVVGGPLVAITQPFVPPFSGAFVLLAVCLLLGVGFWRRATHLGGHLRAGSQLIAEALAAQSHQPDRPHDLAEVQATLPGIGHPTAHRITDGSDAVGKTLAELDLRGQTGATVLAIRRGTEDITLPPATQQLEAGDVVTLVGSHAAINAARTLLG